MILLDTDHFNVIQIGKRTSYETLAAYMDASPDQHFATTVVTFEEHMRGWLAGIRRARDVAGEVRPYDQLINLVSFFQAWEILRFDENAAARFRDLRQQRVRIGTMDLKIASIALEQGVLASSSVGDVTLRLYSATNCNQISAPNFGARQNGHKCLFCKGMRTYHQQ